MRSECWAKSKLTVSILLVALVIRPMLVEDCVSTQTAAQPTDQVSSIGPQAIVVILVEFPDSKHAAARESIHDQVFVTMNAYYTEASYNLTWIVGETTHDWIMMPSPFSSYGDMGFGASWSQRWKLVQDAVHVADNQIDFRRFVQIIIVVPKVKLIGYASDKWAIATNDDVAVNRATVQREDRPPSLFAHEMGHSLGLRDMYDHALAAKLGSSDAGAVYMGVWDLMSTSFRGCIHFSSYNKIRLGWIPLDRVDVVQVGQVITVVVDPIEKASTGVHVIKIPLDHDRYYLIESRRQTGFDKDLPDEGVLVTWIDASMKGDGFARVRDANPETTTLDDATFDARQGKNAIFEDSVSGLTIMVLHSVGWSFKVHITTTGNREMALDAWKVVLETNSTIQEALDAGRILGLEEARAVLEKATASFYEGNYEQATSLGKQARTLAEKATKPTIATTTLAAEPTIHPTTVQATTMTGTQAAVATADQLFGGAFTPEVLVFLGVTLIVILAAGVFYFRRRTK